MSGRRKTWLPAYWVGVVALIILTRRATRVLRCEACGSHFGHAAHGPGFPGGEDFSLRCPGCGSEDVERWPAAEFVGLFIIGLLLVGTAICSIGYWIKHWS